MNQIQKLNNDFRIILASASPRRKEILELVGLQFETWPSCKEEETVSDIPEKICQELSRQKALDVASQIKAYNESHPDLTSATDILVIGADTIVVKDKVILGKPKDEADAVRMLKMLSGAEHSVFTGVTLVFMSKDNRTGEYTFFDETKVVFYALDDADIEEYVATGDALDKAGAYGVQTASAAFVKGLYGDFYNVMGLPVGKMLQELRRITGY